MVGVQGPSTFKSKGAGPRLIVSVCGDFGPVRGPILCFPISAGTETRVVKSPSTTVDRGRLLFVGRLLH